MLLPFVVAVPACTADGLVPPGNPVPIVEATEPAVVFRGEAEVVVHVVGLGFTKGAEVTWDGEVRPTVFLGNALLTVTLAPMDLDGTSGELVVRNPAPGGGQSSPITVDIGNPVPVITGVLPTGAEAVITTELTLEIEGVGFVTGDPGTEVLWDGIPLRTIVLSPTQASATVPDYLLRLARSVLIAVMSPAPGGGVSNALFLSVENPVPVVSEAVPNAVTVGTVSPLSVLGTGFVDGASVFVEGTELDLFFLSGNRLNVEVPWRLAIGGTTPTLTVVNPGPGGGTSNGFGLLVTPGTPQVLGLDPVLAYQGSSGFPLTVTGIDFDPESSATVGGIPRTAIAVDANRVDVSVSPVDVEALGLVEIRIINPGPGGGESSGELRVVPAGQVVVRLNRVGVAVGNVGASVTSAFSIPALGMRAIDAFPDVSGPVLFQIGSTPRVHELDPSNGTVRRVTRAQDEQLFISEQRPRYGAEGIWIYFQARSVATGAQEIWRVRTAGGPAELVVGGPDARYGCPSPSHSGDFLVYSAALASFPPQCPGRQTGLYLYDLTTGVSTALPVSGTVSRWTPDDAWILYITEDGELRTVRPDGSGDFAIPVGEPIGEAFDVSPDGNWIIATLANRGSALILFPGGHVLELPGWAGELSWYGP